MSNVTMALRKNEITPRTLSFISFASTKFVWHRTSANGLQPESRAKHWFHSTNNQLGVYPKHNLIANIIIKITKTRDSEAYMAVNIWVWYSGSYDQVVMKPNTVGLASVL